VDVALQLINTSFFVKPTIVSILVLVDVALQHHKLCPTVSKTFVRNEDTWWDFWVFREVHLSTSLPRRLNT